MTFRMNIMGLAIFIASIASMGCSDATQMRAQTPNETASKPSLEQDEEHYEVFDEGLVSALACTKASRTQISLVNQGNAKKSQFLQNCSRATGGSRWCAQLIRPNPSSIATFRCTYGANQVHQLIHPNQSTWKNAIGAVSLITELEQKGLRVCQIYNWWRPEPYNKNVGGAAGRHPQATSIDVRFCSNADADRAFVELCKFRKQGRIRAIGHYGTSALHFGIGDASGNTWGRTCPK